MDSITAQELFTDVVTKVVAQGRPSKRADTAECLYRGPGGLKCAAGHAITDEEYAALKCNNSDHISELAFKSAFPNRLRPHVSLLGEMQAAHDHASIGDFAADFVRRAQSVAESNNLTMPVLP